MNQCNSVTKSGARCKRQALPKRCYCWQHEPSFVKWVKNISIVGVFTIFATLIGLAVDIPDLYRMVTKRNTSISSPSPESVDAKIIKELAYLREVSDVKAPTATANARRVKELEATLTVLSQIQQVDSSQMNHEVSGIATKQLDAQPDNVPSMCLGVDLVLLVDQSASMITTDPYQTRYGAIATILTILIDDSAYHCPDTVHRIAVIGFGDEPEIYVDSYIDASYSSTLGWRTKREVIKERLRESLDSGIQNGTDYLAAFKAGHKKFADWDDYISDDLARKRTVILITDGVPCVDGCLRGEETDRFAYQLDLQEFMDPLQEFYPWLGFDNPASVSVFIISLGNIDAQFSSVLGDIAVQHGGGITSLSGADVTRLTSILVDIVDKLTHAQ